MKILTMIEGIEYGLSHFGIAMLILLVIGVIMDWPEQRRITKEIEKLESERLEWEAKIANLDSGFDAYPGNHEVWWPCKNCGADYDARLSSLCDNCKHDNENG